MDSTAPTYCKVCTNLPVRTTGMCRSCYDKARRKTEKGKEQIKLYYIRRKTKRQAERKPRPIKPNCDCGEPSVVKNLCRNCYSRLYNRKKFGFKEGTRKGKCKHNIDQIFIKVLKGVKNGLTIQSACKREKFLTSNLYRLISPTQKAILVAHKTIGFVNDEE